MENWGSLLALVGIFAALGGLTYWRRRHPVEQQGTPSRSVRAILTASAVFLIGLMTFATVGMFLLVVLAVVNRIWDFAAVAGVGLLVVLAASGVVVRHQFRFLRRRPEDQ
jgi:hypothetical protein